MSQATGDIRSGGSMAQSVLVTGSGNVINVSYMERAAQQARAEQMEPARMLRILAVLATPVLDPHNPRYPPPLLDLRDEWQGLARAVRGSGAPILLARLAPPTLPVLRSELSPRADQQNTFPHILHFSGHAWEEGLLLEDECSRTHFATTGNLLAELELPRPLDLVVLNGCESAASAQSVAQAMVKAGLARAVIGHEKPVYDDQAIAFAKTLYRELSDGRTLARAFERARKHVTTHLVQLFGDENLRFEQLAGGKPIIDDALPPGRMERRAGMFLGRGQELVEIACKLGEKGSRSTVVVISGLPGIGKTSLALEAAHRNAWRFSGGAAYAQGPRAGDGGLARSLVDALAGALGLTGENGDVVGRLVAHTQARPTLLVLDNLENLPAPELAELAQVLRRLGEGSAAIVTLRAPKPVLEDLINAMRLPLHKGLGLEDATRYARIVAQNKNIPLTRDEARAIATAVDGHPLLIEKVVALAARRSLRRLLKDVREKKGDFLTKLDEVLHWSAGLVQEEAGDAGLRAWGALQLFPAGWAPEPPLLAAMADDEAAAERALDALRAAALIDFDVRLQGWRWHATVTDYARQHGLLDAEDWDAILQNTLPAWQAWLEELPPDRAAAFIEAALPNLQLLLEVCPHAERDTSLAFLKMLGNRLPTPERTLRLREFIAKVYGIMADLTDSPEVRGAALNDLGAALSELGRREQALAAAQEAVDIYRELAAARPEAFLPALSMSLSNLGNMLSGLGRRKQALAVAQEGVKLLRQLAADTPNAFLPKLAMSLNNLGHTLSDMGQWQQALDVAQEAADLYRELTQGKPDSFLPELAMSLHNLGIRFAALERRVEALEAIREAVAIRRELVKSNHQAFLPDLAMSLHNLGNILSDLGYRKKAIETTQEAVALYRELVVIHPLFFRPRLAQSLTNLGSILLVDLGSGREEDLLKVAQEAVDIRHELAKSNPQSFLPDLAVSLGLLGSVYGNMGHHQTAADTFEEGIRVLAPFSQHLPQVFAFHMRALIHNYRQSCEAAGCEADEALLAPVIGTLERMEEKG